MLTVVPSRPDERLPPLQLAHLDAVLDAEAYRTVTHDGRDGLPLGLSGCWRLATGLKTPE